MVRVCGAALALCYISLLAIGLERMGYWWAANPAAQEHAGAMQSDHQAVDALAAAPRPLSKFVALLSDGGPTAVELLAPGQRTTLAVAHTSDPQVSGGPSSIWRYGQSGGPRAP